MSDWQLSALSSEMSRLHGRMQGLEREVSQVGTNVSAVSEGQERILRRLDEIGMQLDALAEARDSGAQSPGPTSTLDEMVCEQLVEAGAMERAGVDQNGRLLYRLIPKAPSGGGR